MFGFSLKGIEDPSGIGDDMHCILKDYEEVVVYEKISVKMSRRDDLHDMTNQYMFALVASVIVSSVELLRQTYKYCLP